MPDQTLIERIAQAAVSKLDHNSSLDDIEKMMGVVKNASDVEKSKVDTVNAGNQIKLDSLRVWSTIVVPLFSLITVIVTITIQVFQLSYTQQQTEDTQWREVLKPIEQSGAGSVNYLISDPTFVPRFKTFLGSRRYNAEATAIAKRMLGTIVDKASFDDLFSSVFDNEDAGSLSDLVEISKILLRTINDNHFLCTQLSQGLNLPSYTAGDYCNGSLPEIQAKQYLKNDSLDQKNQQQLDDWKKKSDNLLFRKRSTYILAEESSEVSQFIAAKLRKLTAAGSSDTSKKTNLSLSGSYISGVDLSGIDFSNVDLSSSTFDYVDLSGSNLSPSSYDKFTTIKSNWWDAKQIDQDLLKLLLKTNFPGYYPEEIFAKKLNRDYYVERIKTLCIAHTRECEENNLIYKDQNMKFIGDLQTR